MRSKKLYVGLASVFAWIMLMAGSRAAAQTEKVLHSFNNTGGDEPAAGVIFDAAGNLYGTTSRGGSNTCGLDFPGCGVVFELTSTSGGGWTERVLHDFSDSGDDGYLPVSSLVFDAAGNLYGTTVYGGNESCIGAGSGTGCGMVFELTPAAGGERWKEKIVHEFNNGKDGYNPSAGVILDAAGNLYGTTFNGGAYNVGMAYELTPESGGKWTEKILHTFNSNGKNGDGPGSCLSPDSAGNLYGTTADGGNYGLGTAFELEPAAGGGWAGSELYSFSSDDGVGGYPIGGLIFDGSGNLYGTTAVGGSVGFYGTVFELTPKASGGWTESVVFAFDEFSPVGLTFDGADNLYGTLPQAGTFGQGLIFELTPTSGGGWSEKGLYSFTGTGDGGYPNPGLVLDAAGNLYGTTATGGAHGDGTVFEITP